jgi:hypothetical protein
MKAIGQAQGALAALAALLPDEAERVADDGTVTVVGGATQPISFSNAGPPLVIGKVVTGAGTGKGPFKFHVACTAPGGGAVALAAADADFSLAAGQIKAINQALPDGTTCLVTEVDNGGATQTGIGDTSGTSTDGSVVIRDLTTQAIAFTNNFVDPVKLIVSKTVTGTGTGPFAFTVTCTNNGAPVALAAGDAQFTLIAGESKQIKGIPNGATCTVTETDSRGASRTYSETSGTANDGIVIIPVDGAAQVTVTNAFVAVRPADIVSNPPVIAPRTVG